MNRKKSPIRRRIVMVLAFLTMGALGAGGFAVAQTSTNGTQPTDWNNVFACARPNGEVAHLQFRAGQSCARGLNQWRWPSPQRADELERRIAAEEQRTAEPEVDGLYRTLPAGDGTEVHTFIAMCADGKVATGGGFSVDFPQHRANVNVVGSQPTMQDHTPIEGDPEGSVIAHGWEIHVVNNGPETSIRPWVVCAAIG